MYTLKIWNLGCVYVFQLGNLNVYWRIGRLKNKCWPKIQLSIKSHLYWKLSMLDVNCWWGHKSTSVMQTPAVRKKKATCWMLCPILVHFRNVVVTFCFQISAVPLAYSFLCNWYCVSFKYNCLELDSASWILD